MSNALRDMKWAHYRRGYKVATQEAREIEQAGIKGKHGCGLDAITKCTNLHYLSDPKELQISPKELLSVPMPVASMVSPQRREADQRRPLPS